jgi:2-polyprenyl-3-methyl-5-hydroxy-6-metoxy-1,4-benzoquinol methylase
VPNVYTFKDFEGSSHRILIQLIRRHSRRGGSLVDLGAAGGELGGAVRDHFATTSGFEFQVDCIADLQKHFDRAVISDLEKVREVPKADTYVLADVLEHLRNPQHALRLVRESLNPGGKVFISVPNIANITIRLGLMFGIFEYRERGILDETHLRFYTMRSIRREVERAGFRIIALSGSSVPVRLIIGNYTPDIVLRVIEKILAVVTRMWRGLFAYQIILVVEKA